MMIDKAPQSIKPVDTFSDLFKARSFPKKRSELDESGDQFYGKGTFPVKENGFLDKRRPE